jgi:CBS domain containing-hemolysin-like protein
MESIINLGTDIFIGIGILVRICHGAVFSGLNLAFSSFLFATIVIIFLGDIILQTHFSRNPLKMASLLTPVISFYQKIFYIVAKPTVNMLDG